jgi:hypothetical protein
VRSFAVLRAHSACVEKPWAKQRGSTAKKKLYEETMDQKNMENNEKNDNYMKKIILHHQTNLGYPATTK